MSEVIILENLTFGLYDNATDLCEAWLAHPQDFGKRETDDIRGVILRLQLLLSAIETRRAA